MAVVAMKQLLEAGVHFGHQTRRWDPKMAEYIFQARNGIHIIDLQKTSRKIDEAYSFVREQVEEGKTVLFVGTKKQAQECMKEAAISCGMFYIDQRWLGGMLTNFNTIRTRVERLKKLEAMEQDGTFEVLPKKEVILLKKEMAKLETNLGGIKDMEELPGVIFIVDSKKEEIAIKEAINALGDREKRILSARFFKGKTQMEVAAEIGISQAQVSRLEKGALDKIKGSLQ